MTIAELDEFARRQWEGVLGYMVSGTGIDLLDEGVKLSHGVKALLQFGELVVARGKKVEITQAGFAFILQEVNAQVWTLLVYYLDNAEKVCTIPFALQIPYNSRILMYSAVKAANGSRRCSLISLYAWQP